jgi:monovalent cation/proton antiporter MnhG/PhaG subunit
MSFIADSITILAVSAGAVFFLAGTVGLLRFPDSHSRLHALTKADNLGLGLVILGLVFQAEGLLTALKITVVWLVTLLCGATISQLIASTARSGVGPCRRIALAFDIGLALLVLGVAAWTIAARDTFAAVVGFVAYGLLLALVWVRLAAPDVALTEAALGSGLTGRLLVGASTRSRRGETAATVERAAAVLCAVVSAGLAALVLLLPHPAPTLAPRVMENIAATSLGNPVTAVLMAYRAIDTLLETVVLLLSLVGIWSMAPNRFWGGLPGLGHQADRDSALTFMAQLLVPVGVLVGIHIFWVGSVAPGGEFQGATILAAMLILAMMAGVVDAPPVSKRWLRLLLVSGPAVFLAIGFVGFATADAFLAYPQSHAKLLILIIEIPVTLSIAATLALLVAGPPERMTQR